MTWRVCVTACVIVCACMGTWVPWKEDLLFLCLSPSLWFCTCYPSDFNQLLLVTYSPVIPLPSNVFPPFHPEESGVSPPWSPFSSMEDNEWSPFHFLFSCHHRHFGTEIIIIIFFCFFSLSLSHFSEDFFPFFWLFFFHFFSSSFFILSLF